MKITVSKSQSLPEALVPARAVLFAGAKIFVNPYTTTRTTPLPSRPFLLCSCKPPEFAKLRTCLELSLANSEPRKSIPTSRRSWPWRDQKWTDACRTSSESTEQGSNWFLHLYRDRQQADRPSPMRHRYDRHRYAAEGTTCKPFQKTHL
jgi:hypothetical protein